MAYDTVIDKTRQQAACKATADAIRGKTGSTAKLTWDPDTGFKNAVNAISTGPTGITPTGTKTITMNGTHNVGEYEYAQVNVETNADPTLQSKSVTPQATAQTVKPDTGYDGLFQVTVNGDSDLIASNIKKGVQIFNITGTYEGASTSGITPTGTKTITTNGTHDVTSYAYAEVNVPTTGGDVVYGDDIEVGSLSELHSWEKYMVGGDLYETEVSSLTISSQQNGTDSHYEPVDYASDYDTSSGKIVLVNPSEKVTFTNTSSAQVLLGKYIQTYALPNQYATDSSPTGNYYRIDPNATVSYTKSTYPTTGYKLTASPVYRLTYAGAEDQLVGIVVSEDSTAYPQNGTQDGYKYVYTGTLDNSGCDHTSVAQATPVITVNSGVITATSTQSAGLVSAGTKTATKSDANLVAGNIKQGVSIFGVTGTYEGTSGAELPTLTNRGYASDLAQGKELIGPDGSVVTGTLATKASVMVDSGGTISEYDTDEFKISGTISSSGLPAILKSGATATIYTYRSAYGDATEDDVRAGKTFTSAAGVKKTGKATIGSGSTEQPKLDGAYIWQKCTADNGWNYTTEHVGTTRPSDVSGTMRKEFTITDDGYFELSTETTYLSGYYAISGGNGKSIYSTKYNYASSGSSYTDYYKLTLSDSKEITKGQFVSYVTSDSENAYPDNGVSDGYWYVKLVAVDAV